MKDFRDLKVWEKAHQLTLGVYPREELYGLTSKMRNYQGPNAKRQVVAEC